MVKKLFIFVAVAVTLYLAILRSPTGVYADDPLAVPNNRFGIHIQDENDIEDAAKLVNSSGGDWGYVTFVIREDERDTTRWQNVFDKLRRNHLIPIVRIATLQDGSNWTKPNFEDIENWISFLNSLNWVIKNRYIIIGNEPNHATEWGGEVKPDEYAIYLKAFSTELKAASSSYFVLAAGLDASAPNNKVHMSETTFIQQMLNYDPKIFEYIDGWNSHSYPNPDFSGSATASGFGTIKSFLAEIAYLKKLGVTKDLPVFITETGWAHSTPEARLNYLSPEKLSDNYTFAYQNVWNDQNVVAVTPFILNYQQSPYDNMSWKTPSGSYYPFYQEVQTILKPKGKPVQITTAEIKYSILPEVLTRNDKQFALGILYNSGQKIWAAGEETQVSIKSQSYEIFLPIPIDIEPRHSSVILYHKN